MSSTATLEQIDQREVSRVAARNGQRRCTSIVKGTYRRCVRGTHMFGDCVDEDGFTGRYTVDRKTARATRESHERGRAWAAQLFKPKKNRR